MGLSSQNNVLAGTVLARAQIQSSNFVTKTSGWQIQQGGAAEFDNVTIRSGAIVSGTALYYSPSEGAGNLVASISAADGTDTFGNAYLRGMTNYNNTGSGYLAVSERDDGVYLFSAATEAGPWTNYALLGNNAANGVLMETTDGTVALNMSPATGGAIDGSVAVTGGFDLKTGTNPALGSAAAGHLKVYVDSTSGMLSFRNDSDLSQTFVGGSRTDRVTVASLGNTTNAGSLATVTIPANDAVVGSIYELIIDGFVVAPVSETMTLTMLLGGVQIGNTASPSVPILASGSGKWTCTMRLVCRSTGNTGTWQGCGDGILNNGGITWNIGNADNSAFTVNTTVSNSLVLQGKWGGTGGATQNMEALYGSFRRLA